MLVAVTASLLEDLSRWIKLPQRRLVLLAHRYEQVERRHPRFVAWRRLWTHAVDAWSPSDGVEVNLPTLLLDDQRLCLQLHDKHYWRGRVSQDEGTVRQWHDEVDALLQRCEAAFPAHPLGL